MTQTQHHILPDNRRIAYRHTPGSEGNRGPTLVFLPGYMSDMAGSKAQAVFDWASVNNQACLLLDYTGCGESSGEFKDGTLSRWREEVLELVAAHCPGQVVLIGSSMGGWLMLLVGLELGERLAGLIGIAPAPDFTAWGYSDEQQAELLAGEIVLEENAYGPQPMPTYPGFWADGETHLLTNREIALDCPVRILQGQSDPDVPWEISLQLASDLRSADVQVTLIKDGDHSLSRPQDIALLLSAVAELCGAP
jgi:pimeloyl-ACP methyl ester carboxylesterase